MRNVRRVALVAATLLLGASCASPFEGFCSGAIAEAIDIASHLPDGMPVEDVFQSPGTPAYAIGNTGPAGGLVVELFPDGFALTPEYRPGLQSGGPCSPFAVGILVGQFYHEMLHHCASTTCGLPGGKNDPCNDKHSCLHLAIDFKVATQLCDKVHDALTANPPQTDLAAGMCAEIKRIRNRWNNSKGAAKAAACRAGGGACPFVGCMSQCGLSLPPAPSPSDPLNVIPSCPHCP